MEQYLIFGVILLLFGIFLFWIFHNPYKYPYKVISIDISNKRNVQIIDEIDRYLCNNTIKIFHDHYQYVQDWKKETEGKISNSLFKNWRKKQYKKVIDDENMFIFSLIKGQTRYRQKNYVRTPYKVEIEVYRANCSIEQVEERYAALSIIGFECTISEYNSKEQRKLMTKDLRERIKIRDNYTCQICGKYMPDEVGLHIDHIIPISKGGKSVQSNLQVLCSKCNGIKSNKF